MWFDFWSWVQCTSQRGWEQWEKGKGRCLGGKEGGGGVNTILASTDNCTIHGYISPEVTYVQHTGCYICTFYLNMKVLPTMYKAIATTLSWLQLTFASTEIAAFLVSFGSRTHIQSCTWVGRIQVQALKVSYAQLFQVWFKYDLWQKYYAPQVLPDRGSISWPPDHDSTLHVTETPALTTRPSVTTRDRSTTHSVSADGTESCDIFMEPLLVTE